MFFNSTFTVNTSILARNGEIAQKALGNTEIIPVLKGDAYGYGTEKVYNTLKAAIAPTRYAVAHVSEAAELRRCGSTEELMLISGVPLAAVRDALELGVTLTVANAETARHVARLADKPAAVQIELDCGLNRYGTKLGAELDALIAAIKSEPRLRVSGVYTHFTLLDFVDEDAVRRELDAYLDGVARIEAAGIEVPLRHAASSNVSEWFPAAHLDAVRLGRRLYMGPPRHRIGTVHDDGVREPGTWRSTVTAVRRVTADERLGYGGEFCAGRDTTICLVSVGYADGLEPRLCSVLTASPAATPVSPQAATMQCNPMLTASPAATMRGAPVLVNGRRARLLGANMDSCYIDAGDCDAKLGDEVVFFGRSASGAELSAQDLAALIDDEGVYLSSRLTARVGREYVD